MVYTKTTWVNDTTPAINATNLNHLETQYDEAVTYIDSGLAGKITSFADPNADRIVFWDDSAGAYAALTASTGLTISGTSMTVRTSSETQTGIVELATSAETLTGTDTTRAAHPAGVKAVADTKANASHSHAAADIISGTMATARLGSGTADGTTFLRGDSTWATPAGGGSGIPETIVNAVGDLIVGAGDDFPTRLAVGADRTTLTADSGQAVGVRWAAPGEADVNTVAASGATETLSGAYSMHRVTMDQACTFTFTSPPDGAVFALLLSGAFTPTFPASVDWPDGTPPTYTTPSLYVFSTFDGGTTWLGSQIGKAFS